MRLRECSLWVLIVLTTSLPAQASQWYPIDQGRLWVYSVTGGGTQSAAIEAPMEFFADQIVQPLRWDSGVKEHLLRDQAGRVFMHGATYPNESYVVFDPPMLRMDYELSVDHEWETTYDVIWYTADGVEDRRELATTAFHVIAIGPVEVAAGNFQSVEILVTEDRSPVAQAASIPLVFRDTFAEGIGWIRRTDESGTSVLFELESYTAPEVATEPTTWGKVKALYR